MTTSEAEPPLGAPSYLRAWRKAAGLTQAQVEKILGWQKSRVSNLEVGQARITDQVLRELAPLYGAEPADLLRTPPAPEPQMMGEQVREMIVKLTSDFSQERLKTLIITLAMARRDLDATAIGELIKLVRFDWAEKLNNNNHNPKAR